MRKSTPKTAVATVYKLIDPLTSEVRYVGQTTNLDRRYKDHLHPADYRTDKLARWVRSLARAGLQPQILVIQITTAGQAEDIERFWIKRYAKQGYRLLNISEMER